MLDQTSKQPFQDSREHAMIGNTNGAVAKLEHRVHEEEEERLLVSCAFAEQVIKEIRGREKP